MLPPKFLCIACVTLAPLATILCLTSLAVGEEGSQTADVHQISDAQGIEFFENAIRPLLVAKCYECHAGEESQGGLRVDSKQGLQKGGDSGAAVDLDQPSSSLILEAIEYKNLDLQMPPDGRLSDIEISRIRKWLTMGAPDPRARTTEMVDAGPRGMSIEEGREFWCFRPVQAPAPPEVEDSDWVQTPVDAFVLGRLENEGLRPAEPASKRKLLRRLTFDLTGLPPTSAEIDAFVSDTEDEAVQRVVDRLLASPAYGQRWGRHWLDVARYADSNGLDENLAFGNAWRYRDYVVDAFNRDKPFDKFLMEQIAGDLLPSADRETQTATGFLMLGAKVLAEPDREKLVMDTVDEQLDSMGKAFLGMTFGCVRCHDHKFDPVKQTDYYALAAIFRSTQTFANTSTGAIKHWNERSFATTSDLAELKIVDAEIAAKKKVASSFKNKAMAEIRADARRNAAKYLAAAVEFQPDASFAKVAEIAKPLGLHPRILHHCRLHLSYNTEHSFFGKWHAMAATESRGAIERHYRDLFERAEMAWKNALKVDPKTKELADSELELARVALNNKSGFLAVPPKPEFAFDRQTLQRYDLLMEEARVLESNAPDEPAAMSVTEGTVLTSLPIHIRGSHNNLGAQVSREFPEVMRTNRVRPILPKGQSGRLELARWMASTQHPLTARVYVNRVWGWHFGRGIVGSTENFGKLGDRPTHPGLLDWLAREFMASGWSTKTLHRMIVLSSTYQQSTMATEQSIGADPEGKLLSRFRMRRLDAEQIRDAILMVAGDLDCRVGGKTVPLRNRQFVFNHTSVDHTQYTSRRRALYLPVIRNNLYSLFAQFDFPDPTMPTGTRGSTIVAPQALFMMNADLIMDSANRLATNIIEKHPTPAARLTAAFARVLNRPASASESARAIGLVRRSLSRSPADPAHTDRARETRAWSLLIQSLIASNEFMYVE